MYKCLLHFDKFQKSFLDPGGDKKKTFRFIFFFWGGGRVQFRAVLGDRLPSSLRTVISWGKEESGGGNEREGKKLDLTSRYPHPLPNSEELLHRRIKKETRKGIYIYYYFTY